MKNLNTPNYTPGYVQRKKVFAFTLFFLFVLIINGLWFLFGKVVDLQGNEIATIGISILIIGLFILLLLSTSSAALLTFAVRRNLIVARSGSWLEMVVDFWVRLVPALEPPILSDNVTVPTHEPEEEFLQGDLTPSDIDELWEYLSSRKKGGRKSDQPDEVRFRIVRDWILMQRRGTSVKLQDLLNERFGYHPDGSPIVPKETFYGWYRNYKQALKKYRESGN